MAPDVQRQFMIFIVLFTIINLHAVAVVIILSSISIPARCRLFYDADGEFSASESGDRIVDLQESGRCA